MVVVDVYFVLVYVCVVVVYDLFVVVDCDFECWCDEVYLCEC